VKPKELFRNPGDFTFRTGGAVATQSSTDTGAGNGCAVPVLSSTAIVSNSRPSAPVAPSSTAAAEAQRAVGLATSKSSGHLGTALTKEAQDRKAAPSSSAPTALATAVERQRSAPVHGTGAGATTFSQAKAESASTGMPKKKAQRRSATFQEEGPPASTGATEAPAKTGGGGAATGPAAEGTGQQPNVSAVPKAPTSNSATKHFPQVPVFSEPPRYEDCMALRHKPLGLKLPEDNYEISDHGASDDEEAQAKDRIGKHVPKWCETYLDALNKQSDIDPDTIFGSKVPKCALEDIFDDAMYRQAGKNRPKRARGSSGDWRKDRLTKNEIQSYKSRMGHSRTWKDHAANGA